MIPRFARRFADALLAEPAAEFRIPGFDQPILVTPGIRKDSRIYRRNSDAQILRHTHEYTFSAKGMDPRELSVQFYENNRQHWRLFAYCRTGMLFSVNLTTPQQEGASRIPLCQRLKSSTRKESEAERDASMTQLAQHLREQGIRVSRERDVDLGDFDVRQRIFVRTTARRFMRNFVTVAVIKGHFMGNKRYSLPGVVPIRPLEVERVIAEDERAFDPADDHDARERTLAAIVRRQGQGRFRELLLAAYGGRCAVTGSDASDALEAAHILGYRGSHTNDVRNGLLLRADIHTLFDLGHITVNSDMSVRISEALGRTTYKDLAGRKIALPKNPDQHPSTEAIDKHREKTSR